MINHNKKYNALRVRMTPLELEFLDESERCLLYLMIIIGSTFPPTRSSTETLFWEANSCVSFCLN